MNYNHYFYKDKKVKDKINTETRGFNSGSIWKYKKKIFPQARDPPTAMLDSKGVLKTNDVDIKEAAIDAYKDRLRNREEKKNTRGTAKN